jgi:hypothetical protein
MDNQFNPNPQQPNQWQQQGQWQQSQQQQYQQQQNWQNPQPNYQDQNGQWQPNPNYPNPNLGTVGFADAIKICFSKYADFKGRAPRAEYWWWVLFTVIANFALGWIPVVGWLVSLALFIPGLSVSWRRFHDIGKGGGWYFLGFVPGVICAVAAGIAVASLFSTGAIIFLVIAGLVSLACCIVMLVWLAREGEPHPNRFGPNPYGINDGCAPWQ